MNIDKAFKILKEEFKDGFKYNEEYYQVFKNPNSREIKEIRESSEYGTVRFALSYKEKLIYMWPGDILHEIVLKKANIEIPYDLHNKKSYCGVSVIRGNKLYFPKDLEKIFKKSMKKDLVDFYSKFFYMDK